MFIIKCVNCDKINLKLLGYQFEYIFEILLENTK
jgi:hypothetical protein